MSFPSIQPIGPIRPIDFTRLEVLFSGQSVTVLLRAAFIAALVQLVTAVLIKHTPKSEMDGKNTTIYHIVTAVAMSTMLFFFGWSTAFLKGVIFLLILLYAAVSDIQTREVSDCMSAMLLIAAFIGVEPKNYPYMAVSGLVIGGTLLLSAIITKNRIGGADIKLSAACATFLGLWDGVIGLMLGLLLSVIINLVLRRKEIKQGFPLVPYLAAGFMAAYIF